MSVKHTFGDEDNRPDFVEAGVYPATIKKAEEKISKSSGNDMIEILWQLENGCTIFDYLTFSEKSAFKADTFLKATGHAPKKGDEVEINADEIVGYRAFLDLVIEPAVKDKDTDAVIYPAKNKVSKYVTDKGVPESTPF